MLVAVEAVEGHHLRSYLVVAIQVLLLLLVPPVLLVPLQVLNLMTSLKHNLKLMKNTKINMDWG